MVATEQETLSKEIHREKNNGNRYAVLCITTLLRCNFVFVHTSTHIAYFCITFSIFSLDLTGVIILNR